MSEDHVDVLIIGAGLSGIGTACHLTAESPQKTFAILEARDAIGGTWDLFRYPGIRSDSDMFTLGYDFRPWEDGKAIADGPAIRSYVILEGRDAIGGTWDLFRYPGIRSDSDMYTLGYAFKPWREAKAIADGPSILRYVRDTAASTALTRRSGRATASSARTGRPRRRTGWWRPGGPIATRRFG